MKNTHNWPLEHWHIEVCSKCSLQCPRCSRQEVPDGLTNTDLTLDWFKKNFVDKILTDVRKITFCGDDGDPIYAKEFIAILKWLRENNKQVQFVIVTNGSYKTAKWWSELADVLDSKDHIHFSLDGWDQKSNNIYRVNCDWQSIMTGIEQLKTSAVYKTWAAIAFKFNEEKLDHMKQMAKTLGFDHWQLTMSTKFGKNYQSYPTDDPLQPSDRYVAQGRFTRVFEKLTDRQWIDNCAEIFTQRFFDQDTSNRPIMPLCMIGNKGLYINAKGHFRPCCWTGLRYGHNKNIFNYINFDSSLAEVLDDPMWHKLFADMAFGEAPQECREKCSKAKWNLEHATGW